MMKHRKFGDFEWAIESKGSMEWGIEGTKPADDGSYFGGERYSIRFKSPKWMLKQTEESIEMIKFIWTLEREGVFDTYYNEHNKDVIDSYTKPLTNHDDYVKPLTGGGISQPPYNQSWITYGPGNTILCSNQPQACCKNNDDGITGLGKHD